MARHDTARLLIVILGLACGMGSAAVVSRPALADAPSVSARGS